MQNGQTFVWMSLIKGMENLLGSTMKFFTWLMIEWQGFDLQKLYLFCNDLLNNLVKARQIENITNSTQFIVNFRSLEFQFLIWHCFISRLPSRSRLGSHQPMVSGWPDNKQIAKEENFFSQLLTRGLNTTRSIPLKPKSEIFAGIPFTWKQRISQLLFVTHIFTLNSTTRLLAKTMSRSIIISFLLMFCSCILIPVILGGTCPKVFQSIPFKKISKK